MSTLMLILFFPQRLTEAEHVNAIAMKYNAKIEVRLWDKTRVDMLNSEYAIEVDFARKWAEAIGQSLYYGIVTGKKPAIVLLVGTGEERYVYRCQTVCAARGIKLFTEKVRFRE